MPALDDKVLAGFLDLLSKFFRSVGEGFGRQSAIVGASVRYHHSQSFKLEILKSVLQVAAPDQSKDIVANAISLADHVIDSAALQQES